MLTATLSESRGIDFVRRSVLIDKREIWWEITGAEELFPPQLTVHDMAVTATVFLAMRQGKDLFVNGPVSESMLENIEDLIAMWVIMRPDLYKNVKVTASEEVPDSELVAPPKKLAIAAFSGGLDASFTAWRHAKGLAGHRNREVLAGVLIHGFDIPLDEKTAFDITYAMAEESLKSINVPIVVVKSNWMTDCCTNWGMECGIGISTCLRNWQGAVDTALVASDGYYLQMGKVTPWVGNPINYSMMSNSNFKIVCDGNEFSRSEKVRVIKDWEVGLRNLRVCWAGPVTGHNCGVCEKCVRTKLNFLAFGMPIPASLPGKVKIWEILRIHAGNIGQLNLLEEVLIRATEQGIKAPWVRALAVSVAINRLLMSSTMFLFLVNYWLKFRQKFGHKLKSVKNVWRAVRRLQYHD